MRRLTLAILLTSARAARTPGEQLHYAFPSIGCSGGSGTFADLVHPTPSILTPINEVARNLGGSEATGGSIHQATYVWNEAMPAWCEYSQSSLASGGAMPVGMRSVAF